MDHVRPTTFEIAKAAKRGNSNKAGGLIYQKSYAGMIVTSVERKMSHLKASRQMASLP